MFSLKPFSSSKRLSDQICQVLKQQFAIVSSGKLSSNHINQFLSESYLIPHQQTAGTGSRDACCCNNKMLCVADGFEIKAQHGVENGFYSQELARNIETNFMEYTNSYLKDPKQLIIDSYGQTRAFGSTTCCVLTIDNESPVVYSSYIGDSGFVVYRKTGDKINPIFVSEAQIKSFNQPFRIGSQGDNPTKSWIFDIDVQHNDIIVSGTNGLFDNIDENQILNCVKPFWEKNDDILDVKLLAEIIAKYAFKLSIDPIYNSPFAKAAKQYYRSYVGGKPDDISVIVAQVKLLAQKIE